MDEASRARIREDLERQREAEAFEVDPENWTALEVFLACATQWVYAGMGERVGLNYPALESVMRMLKIEAPAEIFWQVRTIELGALEAEADNPPK